MEISPGKESPQLAFTYAESTMENSGEMFEICSKWQ